MRRGSARWEDATRTDETSVRVRVLEHLASLGKQTTPPPFVYPFVHGFAFWPSHEDTEFHEHDEKNIIPHCAYRSERLYIV